MASMLSAAAGAILCIVFPFLLAYAAASDFLTMKISNRVTGSVVVAFLVYVVVAGLGWSELWPHLAAGGLALLLSFALFARGWIGGGDAKLTAAAALWFGLAHFLDFLLTASLLGGGLTLAILYARTYPLPAFALSLPFAVRLHDRATGIPYGIALSAAALLILPYTAEFVLLATP